MKKIISAFFIIFFCLSLLPSCACGGDNAEFPRHRCNSLKEVRDRIGFDTIMPDFLSHFDSQKYDVKYYSAATLPPKENPDSQKITVVRTGYSVMVDSKTNSGTDYKSMEFRGIDLSRAGKDSENFKPEYDTCTIPEASVESGGKKFFYSAYNPRYYSAQEIAEEKGLASLPSGESVSAPPDTYFQTFYVYFMKDNIRYSVTFTNFVNSPDKGTAKKCLANAKEYFKNY